MNLRSFSSESVPRIAITILVALVVRLIWIIFIDVVPVSDSNAYDILARNIVEYGVYGFTPSEPSAFWAVGTPAIYAGAYKIFGIGPVAVVLVNLISSLLAIWFIYSLGRLYFDETTGRIAGLIFAFWPVTIQFTTVLASELHFMAAMTAGLYFWEKARQNTRFWINICVSGLMFAVAVYIRPVALLIPIVLGFLGLVRAGSPVWRTIASTTLVMLIIVAVTAPWSARNERVFGTYVFVSTNFGPNLWMGNHPGTTGEYTPLPAWANDLSEIEFSERLKKEALEYIFSEPGAFITRTIVKAFKLHSRETIGVVWNAEEIRRLVGPAGETALKGISTLYWFLFLFLALVTIPYLILNGKARHAFLTPPLILLAYLVAVHAVIVVSDRYHLPEIPLIAILAAVLLSQTLCHDRTGTKPQV